MTNADESQHVVIDGEGRYSLWPVGRRRPTGWSATGFVGGRQACLDHIEVIWPDQRRRSMREAPRGQH